MNKITISQAHKLTSPNPFGLVLSKDEKDKVNAMGISWWTYVSGNPNMLLVCLSKRSYTNSNIKRNNEFAFCLPDSSIKEQAWKCSTTSGRNIDKIKEFNIELLESQKISVPILKESHVAFECKVRQIIDAGDHDIFLGDVMCIYGDESKNHLYAVNGYKDLVKLS